MLFEVGGSIQVIASRLQTLTFRTLRQAFLSVTLLVVLWYSSLGEAETFRIGKNYLILSNISSSQL
jgi:hypothetical protein